MSEPAPVSLAYQVSGPPAGPALVLGNSLGTSRTLWDPQLPALERRFRVVRYEHRGHGPAADSRSPAPPGPYRIDDLGGDVLALLDSLGVHRFSYCGLSLGAMVGMWLASHASSRVAALALCCTSAYLPPESLWRERARSARADGTGSVAEHVVGRWFTPVFRAANPAVPAGFAAGLAGTDPEGYAGCCEAIGAMDLRPRLRAITAPTLVIAGAEDPATPPWHGAVIASGVLGPSRLHVIRGAAHLVSVSSPGEVTVGLLEHLLGAGRA